MKTQNTIAAPVVEAGKPGNINLQQLAKALNTSPAAPTRKKTDPTVPAEADGNAASEAAAADAEPEVTPEPEAELSTEAAPEAAAAETTDNPTEEAAAGAEEPASEEAPAQTTLPDEVREAIEIARAQDGGKGKADLLKRVYKLVDQRDTERNARLAAEERTRQLEEQSAKAPASPARATSADPVASHPEVQKVVGQLREVDQFINWCEANPDGGELPDGKGGNATLSAAEVANAKRALEHQRTELVANKVAVTQAVRTAHNQAYEGFHKEAVAAYPWMANQKSAEYQEMQGLLEQMPGLKAFPDYELVIGHYLRGRTAHEASKKSPTAASRKPAPSREPTRVMAEAPGRVTQVDESTKKRREAQDKFSKSGRTEDLARSLVRSRRPATQGA